MRLELTRVVSPTRFRDEFLIRPDRFRVPSPSAERAGVEPAGRHSPAARLATEVAQPLAILSVFASRNTDSGRGGSRTRRTREHRARLLSKQGGRAACHPLRNRHRVDSPGIEPGLPPCHGGVFPLDHKPGCQWNRRELHPDSSRAKRVSSCWTTDPIVRMTGVGVEPTTIRLST